MYFDNRWLRFHQVATQLAERLIYDRVALLFLLSSL